MLRKANKIKITYEEVYSSNVDKVLRQLAFSKTEKKRFNLAILFKNWISLILISLIGIVIVGSLALLIHKRFPIEKVIEIGNSQYVFSTHVQKYFKLIRISDYKKSKSVLIIEEPHYDAEAQFNLYKGLETFFKEHPELIKKTIFLAEGVPANDLLSVKPLIEVEPNPDDELIKKVLSTFLITGYIAYEWKYQNGIPIVGVEDKNYYDICVKLWIRMQEEKDNPQIQNLWFFSVVARNKKIAEVLIKKSEIYQSPILFVGGRHLVKLNLEETKTAKYNINNSSLSKKEIEYLRKAENLGLYDYLKRKKIGFSFLVARSSFKNLDKNVATYTKLFKAQQKRNYKNYINKFFKNQIIKTVTVTPSPKAAAQFVAKMKAKGQESAEGKGEKEGEDEEVNNNDDGGNGKPREAIRKGGKIIEGKEISEEEAAERVKRGEDVKANSKEQAERIARKAGGGKEPIHEAPHKPGYRPHYHPHGHGKGHVFY